MKAKQITAGIIAMVLTLQLAAQCPPTPPAPDDYFGVTASIGYPKASNRGSGEAYVQFGANVSERRKKIVVFVEGIDFGQQTCTFQRGKILS